MSDRSFSGLVDIVDQGLTGMLTLRANLPEATAALADAGVDMPGQGACRNGVLWMSPDEVMILCDYDAAEARAAALVTALGDRHSLVVNVSDARAMFRITGNDSHIREVLAKLSPADLHKAAFPVGQVRRTRLAQVAAAFWFEAEGDARLICFRSVSDYVFGLLSNAAAEGSEVGFF